MITDIINKYTIEKDGPFHTKWGNSYKYPVYDEDKNLIDTEYSYHNAIKRVSGLIAKDLGEKVRYDLYLSCVGDDKEYIAEFYTQPVIEKGFLGNKEFLTKVYFDYEIS